MSNTVWSPERYSQAYWFAAQAHVGQTIRDTDLPYILHPTLVCMEVMAALRAEPGRTEDLAVQCALLHDVIEDCAITAAEIKQQFGAEVATGVQALSKDPALPETEQLADSLRRIQHQPPEIWLVKLADRIANLRPPPAQWTPAKIQHYWEDARLIHTQLHTASPYLAGRLAAKIEAYRTHLPVNAPAAE